MVKRKRILAGFAVGLLVGLPIGLTLRFGPALSRAAVDSTKYSPDYSEAAFAAVEEGMTEAEVVLLLGQPLGAHAGNPEVVRWYGPPGSRVGEDGGLHPPDGWVDGDKVAIIVFDPSGTTAALGGPFPGRSADEIGAALGKPIKEEVSRSVVYWRYTQSPSDGSYHRRWIGFDAEGKVADKKAYFWWD